jgi:hypothetical protein
MATNFTAQTIQKQIAKQSGQIKLTQRGGGFQYTNTTTGSVLNLPPVASSLLSNPVKSNNPQLSATALAAAQGLFANTNVPMELVDAIASVAAYINATQGIPINSLISSTGVTPSFIAAYNVLAPAGAQLGIATINPVPVWFRNQTLRGSIAAAITSQS